MDQPTAGQALRQLESLVGQWTVEARFPDGDLCQEEEGSPSSGTSPEHISSSVGQRSFPKRLTFSPLWDAMAQNGTHFQLYSDERGVCPV